MYFTFVDNGIALQVKSDCSQRSISNYRETPDWMIMVLGNDLGIKKSFKFCQNGNCCSTGVLSFAESREFVPSLVQISTGEQEKLRCKQNNYTEAYELGECGKFDFDFKRIKGGFVTLNGPDSGFKSLFYRDGYEFINLRSVQDAWAPEWVRLVLGNGEVLKCSFDEKMVCKPEGKISFVLGILICTAFSLYFSFSANGLALNKATENITTQISIESSDYGKLELISFM